jgi:hypothetical protein
MRRDLGRLGWVVLMLYVGGWAWLCGDVLQYSALRIGWRIVLATYRPEWLPSLPPV